MASLLRMFMIAVGDDGINLLCALWCLAMYKRVCRYKYTCSDMHSSCIYRRTDQSNYKFAVYFYLII